MRGRRRKTSAGRLLRVLILIAICAAPNEESRGILPAHTRDDRPSDRSQPSPTANGSHHVRLHVRRPEGDDRQAMAASQFVNRICQSIACRFCASQVKRLCFTS